MKYLAFIAVLFVVATGISHPSWLGYDQHTFVVIHIIAGAIAFAMFTIYMGHENGKGYMMLQKNNRGTASIFGIAMIIMGPLAVLAMIGTMSQHWFKYKRLCW